MSALGGVFTHTQGYRAMWGVCSAAILLSVPLLGRMRARVADENGAR